MTELSQQEIEDIVGLLGGGLVAEATDSLPQMPSYWTTSLARPTHVQMLRLAFLKDMVDELRTSMDDRSARQWLIKEDDELRMSPVSAIKRDAFDLVRQAASRVAVQS